MKTKCSGLWLNNITYGDKRNHKTGPTVRHVVAYKAAPGIFFVEIDFSGTCRPEYSHMCGGDDYIGIGFCASRGPSEVTVEFHLPRSMRGATSYGEIRKWTWRGVIVSAAMKERFNRGFKSLFFYLADAKSRDD